MPRHYFHFRAGSSLFKDEVGEVFAEASLALQHGKRIALEPVRGGEPANAAIVVVEGDQQLFEIPLSEHGSWDRSWKEAQRCRMPGLPCRNCG
jgi:hypothetical protein